MGVGNRADTGIAQGQIQCINVTVESGAADRGLGLEQTLQTVQQTGVTEYVRLSG